MIQIQIKEEKHMKTFFLSTSTKIIRISLCRKEEYFVLIRFNCIDDKYVIYIIYLYYIFNNEYFINKTIVIYRDKKLFFRKSLRKIKNFFMQTFHKLLKPFFKCIIDVIIKQLVIAILDYFKK